MIAYAQYSSADNQPRPLTAWGGFSGRRRSSDSPYIESMWEGVAQRSGSHLTAADGTIDLTFQNRRGVRRLLLSGPGGTFRRTTFEAGDEILTIRLRTGVHMPFATGNTLTNVDRFLPSAGARRFWLHGSAILFPTFDTTESFITSLVQAGMLQRDIVIEDALADRLRGASMRTTQRHFLAATGLAMNHVRQIRRAEQAKSLLSSSNLSITDIAYETGYSNPGHMTYAFKQFFGRTPSEQRKLVQAG